MGSRLSSALVQAGLLEVRALKSALARQAIRGGALDTILLEKQLVDEAYLTGLLAHLTGYAPLKPGQLLGIGPMDPLPLTAETANELGVCPIRSTAIALTLLVQETTDEVALEELAFDLGLPLHLVVGPELRVAQACSAVYGRELEPRFSKLLDLLGEDPPEAILEPLEDGDWGEVAQERSVIEPREQEPKLLAPRLPEAVPVPEEPRLAAPEAPEAPDMPEAHEVPEVHEVHEVSEAHEVHEVHGEPKEPAGWDVPVTPEVPETPAHEEPLAHEVPLAPEIPETPAPAEPVAHEIADATIPVPQMPPIPEDASDLEPMPMVVEVELDDDELEPEPSLSPERVPTLEDLQLPIPPLVKPVHAVPVVAPLSAPLKPVITAPGCVPVEIDVAISMMHSAEDRDELLLGLARGAHQHLEHLQIFVVKQGGLQGWLEIDGGQPDDVDVRKVKLPLRPDSLLFSVINEGQMFSGPIPEMDETRKVMSMTGLADAEELLLLPVTIRGRTICVLMGHAWAHPLPSHEQQTLIRLASEASAALTALIVRQKKVKTAAAQAPRAGADISTLILRLEAGGPESVEARGLLLKMGLMGMEALLARFPGKVPEGLPDVSAPLPPPGGGQPAAGRPCAVPAPRHRGAHPPAPPPAGQHPLLCHLRPGHDAVPGDRGVAVLSPDGRQPAGENACGRGAPGHE